MVKFGGCVLGLALAAALGSSGCAIHDPAPPEMRLCKYLKTLSAIEDEFLAKSHRYASLEEVEPLVAQRTWPGIVKDCHTSFQIRMEIHESGYRIYAAIAPKSLARRSLFMDETGVIRESWGPEQADASSAVVK